MTTASEIKCVALMGVLMSAWILFPRNQVMSKILDKGLLKLKTKFTESLSFTYTTKGKRQIQVENFSK